MGNNTESSHLLSLAQNLLEWQYNNLWEPQFPGGFYAAALSDSLFVDRSIQYVDDNAFAGNVLFESYKILSDPVMLSLDDGKWKPLRDRCLMLAVECGDWLVSNESGAWDSRPAPVGGGYWWNVSTTGGPTQYSFRPLNSNGLAFSLLSLLFYETHNSTYLKQADQVRQWLLSNLYNNETGVFEWYLDYSGVKNTASFAYDNGITAAAFVEYGGITHSEKDMDFGKSVLSSTDGLFWVDSSSAYIESTVVTWAVSTTLSGWLSKSILTVLSTSYTSPPLSFSGIKDSSGDELLHKHACKNVNFINQYLRNSDGSYLDSCFLDGSGAVQDYITTLNCAWGQWLTSSILPFC